MSCHATSCYVISCHLQEHSLQQCIKVRPNHPHTTLSKRGYIRCTTPLTEALAVAVAVAVALTSPCSRAGVACLEEGIEGVSEGPVRARSVGRHAPEHAWVGVGERVRGG